MIITFNELRRIKDKLPSGSSQRIADELGIDVETVRNYFGGKHFDAVAGAGIGPNVTTFGDRNRVAGFMDHTVEETVEWIMYPEENKPGNLMTGKYNVTEAEAQAIAEYLMTLKVED